LPFRVIINSKWNLVSGLPLYHVEAFSDVAEQAYSILDRVGDAEMANGSFTRCSTCQGVGIDVGGQIGSSDQNPEPTRSGFLHIEYLHQSL
jgi:hypothetical protein